jgi:threonine aldolase
MGGAMRQIGFMAAAGLFALENNIDRIAIDHKHAKAVAAIFRRHPVIQKVVEPETNIVFLELKEQFSPKDFCASLAARQIMAFPFGKNIVRLVTHMHITREQVDLLPSILDQLKITTVN